MKKSRMRRKFHNTDVEHIALELYKLFHGDETWGERGWKPYKHYKGDFVVDHFRRAAEAAVQTYSDLNPYYVQE